MCLFSSGSSGLRLRELLFLLLMFLLLTVSAFVFVAVGFHVVRVGP